MKKYTTNISLLIGLLSFYTVSSCVSPRNAFDKSKSSSPKTDLERHGMRSMSEDKYSSQESADQGSSATIDSEDDGICAPNKRLKNMALILIDLAICITATLTPLLFFYLIISYLGNPSDVAKPKSPYFNTSNMTDFNMSNMTAEHNTSIYNIF